MPDFSIADLCALLGKAILSVDGNQDARFSRPAGLGDAGPGSITFAKRLDDATKALLKQSRASVVLCLPGAAAAEVPVGTAFVTVAEPRSAFVLALEHFFAAERPSGIHPSAIVSLEAMIDPTAYVGPGAAIGACTIGAGSVIQANVTLYDGVRIGRNVTVNAGTVIGCDGFGYERRDDGSMTKFLHFGGVVIEDDVEIGACTAIDRGTLGDTIVRRGAKIDNHVHVAHNVDVGEDAVLIAMTIVGGSVKIGPRSWLAPATAVMNGLTLGADSYCGLAAVVTKSVPDGARVMGNPARQLDEAKALLAAQKKLLHGG